MPGVRPYARIGRALIIAALAFHTPALSWMAADLAAQTAPLPAPWLRVDLENPGPAGTSSFDQGTFNITVGGTRSSTADPFHFVYQSLSGNVEVTARIDSVFLADANSAAGVMIRSSLSANAPYGSALVSAGNGAFFQQRAKTGGKSGRSYLAGAAPPRWVRAVRIGSTITTSSSANGTAWQTLGSATIPMGTTAYVGIAATSGIFGVATTAAVSEVSVVPLSLPAPQKAQDIGSPSIGGIATHHLGTGTYTITAGGADIGGTSDQFHFVYQPVQGDIDIAARLVSLDTTTTGSAKAGVMIRESLTAGSRHAFALIGGGQGYAFDRRIDAGGITAHTGGGTGAAPGWIRLVRTGSRFQAFHSADGLSWTLIGSDTVPVAETVYVGLAVTSRNASQATVAVAEKLSVGQPSPGPNQPPTVTLTEPRDNAVFTHPASITVSAMANDPEGRLDRVHFYAGASLIAPDTMEPFTVTFSPVQPGTYSLSAEVFDANSGHATSAPVTIEVRSGASIPTTVVFQASTDHATLVTSYRLDVFANGTDPNTGTPVASSDLGKSAPDGNGDITVDQSALFTALPSGTFVATVSAVGAGGQARSAPVTFTR
jgi:regulation of enolase protein 1 (concanavalin A-like superfamily)